MLPYTCNVTYGCDLTYFFALRFGLLSTLKNNFTMSNVYNYLEVFSLLGGLVSSVGRASDFESEGLDIDSQRLCCEFYPWERQFTSFPHAIQV